MTAPDPAAPTVVADLEAALAADGSGVGSLRRHLAIPLFRNAYALVVTTALTSLLGVVYWGVAAHYYSEVEVGRAYAAVASLMLLGGITQLNLVNVLPRLLPQAGTRSPRIILGSYGASVLVAVVVCGIYVALGGADRVLAIHGSDWAVRFGFVAAVVVWNLFTLQDSVLAGLRQAIYVPIENALFAGAKIVLLVILASSLPRRGLFVSWSIPAAIAVVPVSVLVFRRLLPHHVRITAERSELPDRRSLLHYVASDYVGGLFQLSSIAVMPLLVVSILGLRANAFFSTAWIVAGAFDLALANIGVSFTVEGATDEARLPHLARSVARLSAIISIAGAVVVVIAAPFVLSFLGSNYEAKGVGVLRLLALAMPFRACTVLYLSLARVRRHLRQLVVAQAASCAIALGLAAVLLHPIGINGAALAYLVAQAVVAIAVAPSVIRTLRSVPDGVPA